MYQGSNLAPTDVGWLLKKTQLLITYQLVVDFFEKWKITYLAMYVTF
jgi:hypothetical protein